MSNHVAVPVWLFTVLTLLAAWALADRLILPVTRWILRRRTEAVVDGLNRRLSIRLQPFKLTRRQVLIDRVVFDPEVMAAADEHARETKLPRRMVQEEVLRYAREIVPAFNAYVYFRLGYGLARWAARLLYRVRLGFVDEEALARIPPNATVVFLMNHRSNLDYVLVAYMVAGRSALSYAVGEWARVWPLESLIRSMGAYFVRRGSHNALYRRVLQRYVQMATAAGVTQAVYPEGGLSRDGRLRPPKLGLLDYMLRDFDPSGERDVVFVPVGLNYDRTLEDRTLLLDLAPVRQRRGPLAALSTTARFIGSQIALMSTGRWHRFGYACVNFGQPISMAESMRRRSLDLRHLPREERFAAIGLLADELMAAVAAVVPVLPVAVVATVFVAEPAAGLAEIEVKARVEEHLERLEAAGAKVYLPRQDRDYAVAVGLRMLTLRRFVTVDEEGLHRAVGAEIPTLRYYANSIAHFGVAASEGAKAA